jgi:toxin secretion/phage lysis holin
MLKLGYFTEGIPLKVFVAGSGTATSMLVGSFCSDWPVLCGLADEYRLIGFLIGMMMLDMVTGVLASRSEGCRVTSRRLGEGVKRKVSMLAVIAGSLLVGGTLQNEGFPILDLLYRFTTFWFIAVEGLSLYENAARTGIPMPAGLKTIMEKMLQRAGAQLENVSGEKQPPQLEPEHPLVADKEEG